ncbi:MAG: hypothetical protein IKT73_07010, partial [Anaerotignum sp.]|nr:hypothetical protein [Anaerotignum sp.]
MSKHLPSEDGYAADLILAVLTSLDLIQQATLLLFAHNYLIYMIPQNRHKKSPYLSIEALFF